LLFKIDNVCKNFGGVQVLRNMSMEIREAEIVGIMGPNGAGKTTLINMISGLESVCSGKITLNGKDITNATPHYIAKNGIRRSFQTTSNFPERTVADNIRAALIENSTKTKKEEMAEVHSLLEEVDLLHLADKIICNVPTAVSKMVELCRCLVANPCLVLMDELYAGLTWEESKVVTKVLKKKKNELKTSFVLIEHRTEILFDAVDRIVVLSQGTNFFEGLPNEVASNDNVSMLYWGK